MKYIIVDDMGMELPVVFCEILDHNSVAGERKVLSAGFCVRNDDGTYQVWGGSTTLKMSSKPADSDIIQHGIEFRI